MRESKRTLTARGCALAITVVFHGIVIYWLLISVVAAPSAIRQRPIEVTIIDKPRGLVDDVKLAALKLSRTKPALSPIFFVPVQVAAEPPAAPILAAENATADSTVSSSNAIGVSSTMSATGLDGEGATKGIIVYHRVQPVYPAASARAQEQGNVVVGVLIDERGHVSDVDVVQSSGFRRRTANPCSGSPDARDARAITARRIRTSSAHCGDTRQRAPERT